MAQTKRKRRRKHSGTQAGTLAHERSSSGRGRPKGRDEARVTARQRRAQRLDQPPTWRGAVNRAAIAAAIFAVVVILAFGRPIGEGIALAAAMFVIYIPMSYLTDRFIYNRRQRRSRAGNDGRGARSER